MRLKGDANNLHGFKIDSSVYLLMKKLAFWTKKKQKLCIVILVKKEKKLDVLDMCS
jgi:hypothetical protein